MGLIGRIFGNGKEREAGPGASTQFHESEPDSDAPASRNAPRRELVQVVLRDTMRKHGVPSDWIECRMLSATTRSGRHVLHVNLVVRKAHDQLLTYVFAFQDSFQRELARYDPRARDWLMSLGWEFHGFKVAEMPDPRSWVHSGPAPLASGPAPLLPADGPDATGGKLAPLNSDGDVEGDLQALFAIRDAALADTSGRRAPPAAQRDFEPTQPFEDPNDPAAPR